MIDIERFDPRDPGLQGMQKEFLGLLLKGDASGCLALARNLAAAPEDILTLYVGVIQPSMYEVGRLWQSDRISVAQEHLASAIVSRTIAATYVETMTPGTEKKGRVLISCGPGELHEIGSWMVSDLLELEGWEVRYLGGNRRHEEIMETIRSFKPHILGMSVTMHHNVGQAARVIEEVKEELPPGTIRVLLGGQACVLDDELCGGLAAAGRAADGLGAIKLVRTWEGEIGAAQ